MHSELSERTVLVTGSSRGIGRALAAALLDAGARVVLNGLDPVRLAMTTAELEAEHPGRVRGVAFDVSDEAAVEEAVEQIERDSPLDVLVNNAGIQHRVPLTELALSDWERVLRIDLTGAFVVGRSVARRMIPRGAGKIVNICSVQADLARPTIGAYTAAKGGLRNLTRAMCAEWAGSGLQVNAIAPGYIHTEMTQALVDDTGFDAWVVGRTPARRWGTPADLAGPLVFFASAASDFVNGQVLFVDGGMTVVV